MKKLTLLLLTVLLVLSACGGQGNDTNGEGALTESRFYLPVSHKIYAEDGSLLREQTITLDDDGYMTEVSVKEIGYRNRNQTYSYIAENAYSKDDRTLLQTFTIVRDGVEAAEKFPIRYHFNDKGYLSGMTTFSQGEYHMPIEFDPNDYTWLGEDNKPTYPAIDGAAYPIPYAFMNEDGKILLSLGDEVLESNPYAQKIAGEIGYTGEIELPENGDAVAVPEDYVDKRSFIEAVLGATLWQSCGERKEDGTVVVRVAYENGTVAEEVVFRPVSVTAYGAYLGFDWDWFGGGILDSTVFFDRNLDRR